VCEGKGGGSNRTNEDLCSRLWIISVSIFGAFVFITALMRLAFAGITALQSLVVDEW